MNDFRSLPDVDSATRPWSTLSHHRAWLRDHAQELTRFARGAVRPDGGFWWLDDEGAPDRTQPRHTWITSRMTHVFGLANLQGEPGAGPIVDHGLAALSGMLRDRQHGGWFASVGADGHPIDDTKAAYPH